MKIFNKIILLTGVLFSLSACHTEATPTYYRQLGEACNDIDNCDSDFICINGSCRVMCQKDDDCISKKEHCKNNYCTANPDGVCRDGWSGVNCDECADKKFTGPTCSECADKKFTGKNCDKCADKKFTGPTCSECADKKFTGKNCDECADKKFTGPNCDECFDKKFTGLNCDECFDKKFTGPNCNECSDDRFQGTNCDECKYGVNSKGGCSACLEKSTSDMQDKSGFHYPTICIDGRYWMARNMQFGAESSAVCHINLDGDQDFLDKYGCLYEFDAVTDICPAEKGWRLPTTDDFAALMKYAQNKSTSGDIFLALIAKSPAWTNYSSKPEEVVSYLDKAEDIVGFSALPAGSGSSGRCDSLGYRGSWWSSFAENEHIAYSMDFQNGRASLWGYGRGAYFSVRCLKHECADLRFTGNNCDKCVNGRTVASDCRECDDAMTGEYCDQCLNGGYGPDCTTSYGTMQDDFGNIYKTVVINGQTWMAENMKYTEGVTCFADYFKNADENNPVDCTTKKECLDKYGCLYTFADAKKVCPQGWHLPTYQEFSDLLNAVGSIGPLQGRVLQAVGFGGGSNATGFAALPAGSYWGNDYYSSFGYSAYFWSSTEVDTLPGYVHIVSVSNSGADLSMNSKSYGYSVRCVQDKK